MHKKIALITGANRGIGKAAALHLAKQDYFIILIARNEEALKQTQKIILDQGGTATYYVVDVSDATQVGTCIDSIIIEYGRIDLLFNNAGILKHSTSKTTDHEVAELLNINLHGAIYLANHVAAQMKKQKSGYIMNLSSMSGVIAPSFAGVYSASKFGLNGFGEALAKELAKYNIKVTNICPHMTATEMTAGRKFTPDQMIETDDICKTIDYLLGLSSKAVPLEIILHCTYYIERITDLTFQAYGIKN